MKRRWKVTRTWYVVARTVTEATQKARDPGKCDAVEAVVIERRRNNEDSGYSIQQVI